MATIEDLAARLAFARDAVIETRPVVVARRDWPLSERFGTEPEASWGPPETLAHIAEMVPFWMGEAERILDGETEPVPFGRTADDPVRIGIIGRDRTLPTRVLYDRIESGVGDLLARLATLRHADGARRGLHPRLGEITVTDLYDRFVVAHLEEHAQQLSQLLPERT